jgi:DNA-binding MarR family transcriptional regulator
MAQGQTRRGVAVLVIVLSVCLFAGAPVVADTPDDLTGVGDTLTGGDDTSTSSSDNNTSVTDTVTDTQDTVNETVTETSNTTDTVTNTTDSVTETTTNTTDTVAGTTNTTDTVTNTTDTVTETTTNATDTVTDTVTNTTDTVAGTTTNTTTDLTETTANGTLLDIEDGTESAFTVTGSATTLLGVNPTGSASDGSSTSLTPQSDPADGGDESSAGASDGGSNGGAERIEASGDSIADTSPVPADAGAGTIPLPEGAGTGVAVGVGVLALGAIVRQSGVLASTGAMLTASVTPITNRGASALERLLRLFSPLRYSRYDDSDPLEHEARAAVFEVVEESPGSYLSELAERADLPLSTTRHHVRVLEREDLLMGAKVRGKRRFYPAFTEGIELAAAMNDAATASILDALARLGAASVSDLAGELDRDPSTISHHLQRLEADDLVVREREGRAVMNRIAPEVRPAIEPDPAAGSGEVVAGEA